MKDKKKEDTPNLKNMLDGMFKAKKKISKDESVVEESVVDKVKSKKKNKKAKKESDGIKINAQSLEQKAKQHMQ